MKTFNLKLSLIVAVFAVLTALSMTGYAETTNSLPPASTSNRDDANIIAFVRQGCPHCAKAEAFLSKLKHEQPDLKVVIHDIAENPHALSQLEAIAKKSGVNLVRVPSFYIGAQLIVGYSDETSTGQWIRSALATQTQSTTSASDKAGSCGAEQVLSCAPKSEGLADTQPKQPVTDSYALEILGIKLTLQELGLPLFTLVMGLLDGFNPCSIWVLILIISLLAPMQNRARMLIIAGTFVAIEGMTYFMFMAAWLNLFLSLGWSRVSQVVVALLALAAGALNLKDVWFLGAGPSLSIPDAAKPGIYARMRTILLAKNMTGALIGAVILAVSVQVVEFMCTSGFPALYTRILTLRQLDTASYYGYLLLYNLAYLFDDIVLLAIGVITLSQRRLQQKEGRILKLISGLVMVGLGVYLLAM